VFLFFIHRDTEESEENHLLSEAMQTGDAHAVDLSNV